MSNPRWKVVRIPADLAARLERLASEMMDSHVEGRSRLPNEFCEHVPPHHVIARALDDWEGHRERSRARPSPRKSAGGEEPQALRIANGDFGMAV